VALVAGVRLGLYEVIAPIGRGGMGEVYRARDTKLHRDVALKILPDDVANDPDRVARFQREAYVLASLNHPNIAHIHGLEEDESRKALVLELVEGPTLADRIAEGPIPIDEALAIAQQITEALGAAHEAGVIHRDLKPANVKIRPDGTVKVLDFGLAKALEFTAAVSITSSPTITSPVMTQRGVILGTAAYMSPEQARGKPVDKRADIWAFGVVLFEMLTGRRLFAGEDISETMAAVLKVEPDLAEAPPRVRRLLRKCLEKDPRRRLHDIHDAWDLLDDGAVAAIAEPLQPTGRRRSWWAAGLVIALVGAAFVAGRWDAPREPAVLTEARRFRIPMPPSVKLPDAGPQVALSPDGRTLVYRAQADDGVVRLYSRPMRALEATPIPGTEGVRYQGPPFFSPDGQWLAFVVGNRLMKANLSGGQPEFVAQLPRGGAELERPGWNWGGGSWGADGTIFLALFEAGLVSVPAAGGKPVVIAQTEGLEVFWWHPQILPGGRAILFTSTLGGRFGELRVLDLETRRVRTLLKGAVFGKVTSTGHLVFVRGGTMWAVRFDLDRLDVVGEGMPIEPGIHMAGAHVSVALAEDGSLAHIAGDFLPPRQDGLAWLDRRGNETAISGVPRLYFMAPRLSPLDDRVVLTGVDEDGISARLWDFAGLTKLTAHQNLNRSPVWSPDGQYVAYSVQRDGKEEVYWQPWDRPSESRPLTQGSAHGAMPMAFSPDGTRLVTQSGSAPPVIGVFTLPGDRKSPAVLENSFEGSLPTISRDGRWIAYQSNESGTTEVRVRPFPRVDARWKQVSTNGGLKPGWSRATDELFFLEPVAVGAGPNPNNPAEAPGRLMVVPLARGATLEDPWVPRPLFMYLADNARGLRTWRNYDVSKDGQRFLTVKQLPEPAAVRARELVVVQNWHEELKRLVPTR
jgi:serine/threonine-protein kinase